MRCSAVAKFYRLLPRVSAGIRREKNELAQEFAELVLASRSIGVRAFFSRQLLLVMVAAALFAVLWVANVGGPGMGLVPIILYCLFIGNLTTPIMNRLSPLSSRLRFPRDWVAFLIFLFLTSVAIASLTVAIIMPLYPNSHQLLFLATVERR